METEPLTLSVHSRVHAEDLSDEERIELTKRAGKAIQEVVNDFLQEIGKR